MLNKTEIKQKHNMNLYDNYVPNPLSHLSNPRDSYHYSWTVKRFKEYDIKTILDIGCFDGWLDFLLMRSGFMVTGVELMGNLVQAAKRYAERNFINYTIFEGFFDDIDIKDKYDAVICYEVLEHIDLETLPEYISKMESISNNLICISLPNQNHTENAQHCWTPTEALIKEIWGGKNGFRLEYQEYTGIPGNWFISYII